MLVMDWPGSLVDVSVSLSLDEYLALPDDVRAEIVNGALRLMTPTNRLHRTVQHRLATLLDAQMPRALRVQAQELVVFQVTPPTARIPDVVVFRPGHDPAGKANQTFASDVLLCVEVVSRSSKGVDRHEKPAEYARNGIPAYWRIELEPEIVVHTYELSDGAYVKNGQFRRDGTLVDLTLPWIKVPVIDLLGRYA